MNLESLGNVKALALAAVLCLGSAGAAAAQERLIEARALFSSSDDVERGRSSVVFDTLWTFGGPSDTVLASPGRLRPDGAQGVVVFDRVNQTVFRLGANGDLLWSWGSRGEGPGELKAVRTIDVAPDGSVVLVDSGNRRVVRLSADGLLLEEGPVPAQSADVWSVAALADGRLAVVGRPASGFGLALSLWNGDAVVGAAWPAGLGEASMLQHQGRVARWGDKGWVFGFAFGNGWTTFQEARLTGVFPYVEHSDFPEVRRTHRDDGGFRETMMRRPADAGLSLSVVGDTLFVLFGGESQWRGRVLDKFDARTGAYLETDVLPHYASEAVVDGDRAFTIEAWDVFPRIVALARRAAPAS